MAYKCAIITLMRTKEQEKEHSRKYYAVNKEKIKERRRSNYQTNKDILAPKARAYCKKVNRDAIYFAKLKNRFLSMYGNSCNCCRETIPEFLTIQHIHGQVGIKKKQSGTTAYRAAVKEYRPDLYEVLCVNCNFAVRWGRTCPHQIIQ